MFGVAGLPRLGGFPPILLAKAQAPFKANHASRKAGLEFLLQVLELTAPDHAAD